MRGWAPPCVPNSIGGVEQHLMTVFFPDGEPEVGALLIRNPQSAISWVRWFRPFVWSQISRSTGGGRRCSDCSARAYRLARSRPSQRRRGPSGNLGDQIHPSDEGCRYRDLFFVQKFENIPGRFAVFLPCQCPCSIRFSIRSGRWASSQPMARSVTAWLQLSSRNALSWRRGITTTLREASSFCFLSSLLGRLLFLNLNDDARLPGSIPQLPDL